MKLIWTLRAERELQNQVDFIARDSIQAAIDVEDRVLEAVAALVDYPERGRVTEIPTTRELPVKRTSLLAIYSLSDGVVEILHIRHMARRTFDGSND